jgi:hypothetical protein
MALVVRLRNPRYPIRQQGGCAMQNRPWWQHEAAIAWAIILVFPLGILLMWLYAPWRKRFKWTWTGIAAFSALLVVVGAASGGGSNKGDEAHTAQGVTAEAGTPTYTAEQVAYIQTISTQQAQATGAAITAIQATVAARPTSTPIPPPYKLALISASCNHQYDWIVCDGFVKNITTSSMKDVEAVAIFTDDAGTSLSSESSLIDYNPILAGQQSPFKIYASYNPAFSKWRIEFKEFFGGTILTRNDRQ